MEAKVIKAFRERFQGMKLYKAGDTYQADGEERVRYLVSQGFLQVAEETGPPTTELLSFEEFANLSAGEQKKILADLEIAGDDGNQEKREALYNEYLKLQTSAGEVNTNGDPDS